MKVAYSERARRDIDDILDQSLGLFGDAQARIYADLLKKAVALAAEDPAGHLRSIDRSFVRAFGPYTSSSQPVLGEELLIRFSIASGGRRAVSANSKSFACSHQSMDAGAHIAAGVSGLPPE
ncbi:type II toxin-antitoxin system RelE/ParE family toxin [Chenggangzhangella methanolivorans]|uniref:Type II toxin-antitoxin system RelE/ParE family toxin n=1 Tax=Chenggangzhangella methanolivorans TaxID=1437009 RepID=A0A9E6UP07_9HYPH|nr:type II toxin-antitoxin system RelE/ParE family toxin [Chenggangzhangella methanolivorans]QZO00874.1 type II toxin-antitoxin system RelE/ParE family toxin [Chenggangzhangella methanolivorans]